MKRGLGCLRDRYGEWALRFAKIRRVRRPVSVAADRPGAVAAIPTLHAKLDMRLFVLAFSSLVLALAGCATNYTPPTSGDTATVRFVVPQAQALAANRFTGYPSAACEAPVSIGVIGGVGRWSEEPPSTLPGADTVPPMTSLERVLPAGVPYMATAVSHAFGSYCAMTALFQLAPGGQYELMITSGGGECRGRMSRLSLGGDGKVVRTPHPVQQREVCTKGQ